MAEVGQRLSCRVYRLSGLRSSHTRPVCSGESVGSSLEDFGGQLEEQSGRSGLDGDAGDRCLSRAGSQQVNWTLHTSCLNLDSCAQTRQSSQTSHSVVKLSPGKLPPATRRTSWNSGSFRFPQHLTAFCVFVPSEQGTSRPLRPPSTRSYSWRGGTSGAPLYRSRTAYYDILDVTPGSTQAQIKTAYYKQSFIYHPDKNPGNTEATQRFSEVSEAYMVLGNISLRRKYDRGILSQSDVLGAGRPSSAETSSRSTGSPQQQQQQQQQQRARRFSHTGGKTTFDFDAFYQAHYGEQLQREQEMRARRQHVQDLQRAELRKWRRNKSVEWTVAALLVTAGLIFISHSMD